jgi:hypothetical protein
MDKKVIPLVEFFNQRGLKTCMSCEGHNKTNMSMFWIQFDKSVTEDDLIQFMNNHQFESKYGKYFASCGRFALRIYPSPKEIVREWNYFAATHEAAEQDLKNWILSETNI